MEKNRFHVACAWHYVCDDDNDGSCSAKSKIHSQISKFIHVNVAFHPADNKASLSLLYIHKCVHWEQSVLFIEIV